MVSGGCSRGWLSGIIVSKAGQVWWQKGAYEAARKGVTGTPENGVPVTPPRGAPLGTKRAAFEIKGLAKGEN